jgi:hypothetical protein
MNAPATTIIRRGDTPETLAPSPETDAGELGEQRQSV